MSASGTPLNRLRGIFGDRWSALLGAYWLALFVATHWPKVPSIDIPGKDRTLHAVAYAILTVLFLKWLQNRLNRWGRLRSTIMGVVLLAAYGAIDELLQVPVGRTADVLDWLADVGGILAAVALLHAGSAIVAFVRRR